MIYKKINETIVIGMEIKYVQPSDLKAPFVTLLSSFLEIQNIIQKRV